MFENTRASTSAIFAISGTCSRIVVPNSPGASAWSGSRGRMPNVPPVWRIRTRGFNVLCASAAEEEVHQAVAGPHPQAGAVGGVLGEAGPAVRGDPRAGVAER